MPCFPNVCCTSFSFFGINLKKISLVLMDQVISRKITQKNMNCHEPQSQIKRNLPPMTPIFIHTDILSPRTDRDAPRHTNIDTYTHKIKKRSKVAKQEKLEDFAFIREEFFLVECCYVALFCRFSRSLYQFKNLKN